MNMNARLLLTTSLLVFSLALISNSSESLAQDDEIVELLSTPNWSMTGYDLQNTSHNRSELRLAPPFTLQWTSPEQDFGINIESAVIHEDRLLIVESVEDNALTNSRVRALGLSGNNQGSLTATELWSFDLGFSGPVESTPAVADGVAYFGGQDSGLNAVDLDTGELVWNYDDVVTLNNSSPKVLGDRVIIMGSLELFAIDRETGTAEWQTRTNSTSNATPAIFNNEVFVSSCVNNTQGFGPDSFYSLGAEFGRFLWIAFAIHNCEVLPVIDGEGQRLYTISNLLQNQDQKMVRAFNLDGESEWQYQFDSRLLQDNAHLSFANGILFLLNRDNTLNTSELFALDGMDGSELWRFELDGRSSIGPAAIANNIVYTASMRTLYALDAATGTSLWEFGGEGNVINSSPIISDGALYISINNQIHKFVNE